MYAGRVYSEVGDTQTPVSFTNRPAGTGENDELLALLAHTTPVLFTNRPAGTGENDKIDLYYQFTQHLMTLNRLKLKRQQDPANLAWHPAASHQAYCDAAPTIYVSC